MALPSSPSAVLAALGPAPASALSLLLVMTALLNARVEASDPGRQVCVSKPLLPAYKRHGSAPGYGSDMTFCFGCGSPLLQPPHARPAQRLFGILALWHFGGLYFLCVVVTHVIDTRKLGAPANK